MPSSPSRATVAIAVASFSLLSLLSLISSSAAAPSQLGVVRQSSDGNIQSVLGKTFKLAGNIKSKSCAESLTLKKTSPFKGSSIEESLKEVPGASALFSTISKILSVVGYPDISVGNSKCSGDGEVVLANPTDLRALTRLGSSVASIAGQEVSDILKSAEAVVEVTEESGVAVGFDQSPGKCGGATLPSGYAWVKDFEGTLPDIAKAAGVKNAKKDGLYLLTISGVPEDPDKILDGDEPLCVYNTEDNSPSTTNSSDTTGSSNGSDEDKDEDDDDNDNSCFPADALVSLKSGETKRMDELHIGDSVKVGVDEYSSVFMFTHKVAGEVNKFVTLKTESGASISLTGGHYIYADGALVPAKDVRVGASVVLGSGSTDRVVAIGRTHGTGLYNPQTVKGDVVVNGVLASTYTTAVEPRFAHAVLAPFRWMNILGLQCTAFESGGGLLGDVAPQGHAAL